MSEGRYRASRVPPIRTMAVRTQRSWVKLVLATMPAIAFVLIDQIARGESLLAEWWIDMPLAVAFARNSVAGAVTWPRRRCAERGGAARARDRRGDDRGQPRRARRTGSSEPRAQACRIMRVERTLVLLRDESDPRTSVVVAGHGVPPDMMRPADRHRRGNGGAGDHDRRTVPGRRLPQVLEADSRRGRARGCALGAPRRSGAETACGGPSRPAPRTRSADSASPSWRRCGAWPSWAPWRWSRLRCARSSRRPSRPASRRWPPRSTCATTARARTRTRS